MQSLIPPQTTYQNMQTEKEALPPEVRPRETGTGHKDVTVVADSVFIKLDRRPATMRPLCVVTAVLKESAGVGTTRRRGVAQRRVGVRGAAQRVLEAHLLALYEVVAEHGGAFEQHTPLLQKKVGQ
jgi:hypothetical protein